MDAGMSQATVPKRRQPAAELLEYLAQEISNLEKSIVSLSDHLTPQLSPPIEQPKDEDVKFPPGDSQIASKLREFCLRVESAAVQLNELNARVEL